MTRFDLWMAEALYGPKGYYTSPRQILGARGDFTTTPKLSPLLSQKLATEIDGPIIELGPGDGSLALGIRESLNFLKRRKLDYHLVEISPHLRERQKKTLQGKGTWHPNLATALDATGPHATIISNEFFDAFPVRIFRKEEAGISELFLGPQNEEIWQKPTSLPPQDRPISTALEILNFAQTGQRVEVHESIQHWYQEQTHHWKSGTMISIDYGGTTSEIYHRRPQGTLRAYAHHMRLYPPEAYQNPGHQDLTTDVNFDDLQLWGKEVGLETLSYQTQAEYLGTDPEGPDGVFQVLHQTRKRSAL